MVIVVILGLAFGSFVNALVWRMHQQSLPRKKQVASRRELSIATGRSMCTHCQHTLAWFDLIPVFSWASTRGRCRYCQKPIGVQYPLVEIITAGLFALSLLVWPYGTTSPSSQIMLALWLMLLVLFMALAVYDLRWMLLPNRLVALAAIVAAVYSIVAVSVSGVTIHELGLLVGSLAIASGLFYVLFQISRGAWIGGGDVKLGVALGLVLLSPVYAFMMLFFAAVLGLLGAFVTGSTQGTVQGRRVIPFGPCLIAATIIVVLFGADIWHWYQSALLSGI